MWLVLCHTEDAAALWAHEELRRRGLDPVELVSAEALACTLGWSHRVGAAGAAVEIALADGRRIESSAVRGALNRIRAVQSPFWNAAELKEREYVQQELYAFYVSWLHCLPGPVLNPAAAGGLCGTWRHRSLWTRMALDCGLDAEPFLSGNGAAPAAAETVFVAGHAVVHPRVPAEVAEGCRRLARAAETPLLGIGFTQQRGAWRFVDATHSPDLRAGGPPLMDALAEALRGGGA